MKTLSNIVLIITIIFAESLFAQRPPKVYSYVKQLNTFDWYVNAAREWKKVLDDNPEDADAWLNYYTANRMAKIIFPENYAKIKIPWMKNFEEIFQEAENNINGTFEYYYLKIYTERTFDDEFEINLLKAYELGPEREELIDDLAGFYETRRDTAKTNFFFRKWYEMGEMSPGILNWSYNLLNSTEKNSIIITNGDNDTYPPIMLQRVFGIRSDVVILNINLLMIDIYRKKIFEEFDLGDPEIDYREFSNPENYYLDLRKVILNKVLNGSIQAGKNIYFSITLDQTLYEDKNDNLSLTGLTFKYDEQPKDGTEILVDNYENKWFLDYLEQSFYYDISSGVVEMLNLNYIPVFAQLFEYYSKKGNDLQAKKMKEMAFKISEKRKIMNYYNDYFNDKQK